ncbi:MAG: hypothetical protein AAGF73_17980 [Actinomycetota bacterium]
MSERIHDNEPDTSEAVVRALLQAELPELAASPVEYLATSGTDNAMWRIHTDSGRDLDQLPLDALAADLGEAVATIARLEVDGGRARRPGERGGPLGPLLERLDRWLGSRSGTPPHSST